MMITAEEEPDGWKWQHNRNDADATMLSSQLLRLGGTAAVQMRIQKGWGGETDP